MTRLNWATWARGCLQPLSLDLDLFPLLTTCEQPLPLGLVIICRRRIASSRLELLRIMGWNWKEHFSSGLPATTFINHPFSFSHVSTCIEARACRSRDDKQPANLLRTNPWKLLVGKVSEYQRWKFKSESTNSASFSFLLFKCWGPALQLPISIIWEQWMQQCKPSSSLNQKTWTLQNWLSLNQTSPLSSSSEAQTTIGKPPSLIERPKIALITY